MMKRISIAGLLLVCLTGLPLLKAQQLPLYSQYVMNTFLLNPASAGSDGYTVLNLTSRRQWLGYKDGPQTYSFAAQSRMLKRRNSVSKSRLKGSRSGNVGLGANIFNDKNGAFSRTGASFSYAYHLNLFRSQISMGVSGSFMQIGIDKTKLDFEDFEPLTSTLGRNIYTPDFSVGAYYMFEGFYAGVSADQLLESFFRISGSQLDYILRRQYYFMTGYGFEVAEDFIIEPSVMVRFNEQLNNFYDISARGIYKRQYWVGYSFRRDMSGKTPTTHIASTGVKVNEFYFGYAFDYSSSPLFNSSYGTHELILAYKIGDSARRYRWVDRY